MVAEARPFLFEGGGGIDDDHLEVIAQVAQQPFLHLRVPAQPAIAFAADHHQRVGPLVEQAAQLSQRGGKRETDELRGDLPPEFDTAA